MNNKELLEILKSVESGFLKSEDAFKLLGNFPFHNLEHTRLDTQRLSRTGFQEIVFAGNKTPEEIYEISQALYEKYKRVLITKLKLEQIKELKQLSNHLTFYERSGIAVCDEDVPELIGNLAVISAGTSDAPVAEEAELCAKFFGFKVKRINDVGVAGLSRLIAVIPEIESVDVAIVVAGMEGALPGVVCSLCNTPIIAVPTSVGYGVSFSGQTALHAMLVSCSSGMSVVNIDNGFGAAITAARISKKFK